jgi:hypothetical protein
MISTVHVAFSQDGGKALGAVQVRITPKNVFKGFYSQEIESGVASDKKSTNVEHTPIRRSQRAKKVEGSSSAVQLESGSMFALYISISAYIHHAQLYL